MGVRHRLERRERLGRNDEERLGRIEVAHSFREIRSVDVRHEAEVHVARAAGLERLVRHHGPQVRSPDADIHDVADALAGVTQPLPAADPVRERSHPVEHGMHLGHHVDAVDEDRRAARCSQRHVQHGALLGQVDPVAAEHGVDARAQAGLFRKFEQQADRVVGGAVLRIVQVHTGCLERHAFAAGRVLRKEAAQVPRSDRLAMLLESRPGRQCCHGSNVGHVTCPSSRVPPHAG